MTSPEWEALDADLLHTGRIVPIYPAEERALPKDAARLRQPALGQVADELAEYVPTDSASSVRTCAGLARAIRAIHFPRGRGRRRKPRSVASASMSSSSSNWGCSSASASGSGRAGLCVRGGRDGRRALPGASCRSNSPGRSARCWPTSSPTCAARHAMSRLVQGDVGSGKTVVAAAGHARGVAEGFQAALMAPTAILAEQHWRTLDSLYSALPEAERPAVRLLHRQHAREGAARDP